MHYWGWQKLNICFFLKFSEALNIVRGSEIFVNIYKYIYIHLTHTGVVNIILGVYRQEVQKTLRRKRRGDAQDQMRLLLPLIS